MAPSPVILISTYAKEDFADLIAATPAIGFLPKYAVTASAIRDLLARHGHTDPRGPCQQASRGVTIAQAITRLLD
jgi:hypothetical protein